MELLISVDRDDDRPLQIQLYEAIQHLILSGALKAGQRLPSSRAIAEQLGIARNAAVLAYERLIAEDYIGQSQAGIFVNDKLPDASVLLRNAHSETISTGRRIRLGKKPAFSGIMPQLWNERSARPKFEGAFLRHLRRIRRSYLAARDALVDAIEHHFPGGVVSGKNAACMSCGHCRKVFLHPK